MHGNAQATNAKQAFLDMPRGFLNESTADVANDFWKYFITGNFPVTNGEKENPYKNMMQIQNMIIAIQTRNVISNDEVDKLVRRTCKQRPGDLNQLLQQEIGLRAQTHLLGRGRHLSQGVLEHHVGNIFFA